MCKHRVAHINGHRPSGLDVVICPSDGVVVSSHAGAGPRQTGVSVGLEDDDAAPDGASPGHREMATVPYHPSQQGSVDASDCPLQTGARVKMLGDVKGVHGWTARARLANPSTLCLLEMLSRVACLSLRLANARPSCPVLRRRDQADENAAAGIYWIEERTASSHQQGCRQARSVPSSGTTDFEVAHIALDVVDEIVMSKDRSPRDEQLFDLSNRLATKIRCRTQTRAQSLVTLHQICQKSVPALAVRLETVLEVLVQKLVLRSVIAHCAIDRVGRSTHGSAIAGRFVVDRKDLINISWIGEDHRTSDYRRTTCKGTAHHLPALTVSDDEDFALGTFRNVSTDQRLGLVDANCNGLSIHAILDILRGRVDCWVWNRGIITVRRCPTGFVDNSGCRIDHALWKLVVVWIGGKRVLVGVATTDGVDDCASATVLSDGQSPKSKQCQDVKKVHFQNFLITRHEPWLFLKKPPGGFRSRSKRMRLHGCLEAIPSALPAMMQHKVVSKQQFASIAIGMSLYPFHRLCGIDPQPLIAFIVSETRW
nr:hypothetical protein CFP56_23830 [Quercus suber]